MKLAHSIFRAHRRRGRSRTVYVAPLWSMYHGDGARLVRELDALGEEGYMLLQSGPMFGGAVVMGDEAN